MTVSPAPSAAPLKIPLEIEPIERDLLDKLPRTMRRASVVAGAVMLASVMLTTLVAAHLAARALIYPPPAIQLSLASPGTAIHSSETARFVVRVNSGRQLTYTWDFGDGSGAKGSQAQVAHAYATYGYYEVTCAAVDPTGQRASTRMTVTVVPSAPQAQFTVKHDRAYDYIVTLDASASTGMDLHYFWDFGDGVSSSAGLVQQVTHYYQHPGTYGVTLTVVDVAGQTDATTVQVVVSAASFH